MRKFLCTLFFLICPSVFLTAQTHTSVPLEDDVYFFLDNASIKGYCTLPAVRPYSLDTTLGLLQEVMDNSAVGSREQEVALATYQRLAPDSEREWYRTGRLYFNHDTETGLRNRLSVGARASLDIRSNLNTPSFSGEGILDAWIAGDFTRCFSYKLLLGAGLSNYAFDAYLPYTFTQEYDGFQFLLSPFGDFDSKTERAHIGLRIMPELSFAFGDGLLNVNFSRVRRDWQLGVGYGGLLLAGSARPFMAVDLYFAPAEWLSFAFLTGVLEYNKADMDPAQNTIKPFDFQNSISLSKVQFHLGRWVDLSVNSAVVFPKRFELGYMNPLTIPIFYQNMIGDFDNLYLGGTLVVKVPRWGRLYVDILASELRSLDLAHTPQNVYAWQVGAQGVLPGAPTTISLQYTKLEPYMYTHYGTTTPWNGTHQMNTSYINHGEGIGSALPPNTDELKVAACSMPLWFLEWEAAYRMTRHGISPGGSTYRPTSYEDMPPRKDFLRDGVYEWAHSFSLEASYNMEHIDIPVRASIGYTLGYRYLTNFADATGFVNLDTYSQDGTTYKTGFFNVLSLGLKVWY